MTTTGQVIGRLRAENRSAFIAYLPAGFPDVETAVEAGKAVIDNGADILEFGLPYSDPSLDGTVIQLATAAALKGGMRIRDVMASVEAVAHARPSAAVVVMTYWNPVLRYGPERFATDLANAGGAGLITPDLTPDYGQEWIRAADAHDLDKIFLVAPSSTPERLVMTVGQCRGFVYAASLMGVTGERGAVDTEARTLVERTRTAAAEFGGETNICVGLGVSTPEQAREVAGYADGVIVGSALVRALDGSGGRAPGLRALGDLAGRLSAGVRAGR